MSDVRIVAIEDPFSEEDPELNGSFLGVLLLADSMGLIEADVDRLDEAALMRVGKAVAAEGIAQSIAVEAMRPHARSRDRLLEVLRRLHQALEESPVPRKEMPVLLRLFGLEPLAEMLGASPSSLRRYVSGVREVPDLVAARAHFLATVVGDLRGAYNEMGIRRWFERKRSALDGLSPSEALGRDWDPDSPRAQRVGALAHSLVMSPAT